MMSDSSEFLTEGTEAGKKIALFSDGEGDWDRAVVCVVAWLVRSMSLEEALGTMKTQIPDYYMSSPYHSMLKRLAKKPAPKNDKALPKKSQATLPKKVEPKKGESFFIECPSCTSSLMLEITNVRSMWQMRHQIQPTWQPPYYVSHTSVWFRDAQLYCSLGMT